VSLTGLAHAPSLPPPFEGRRGRYRVSFARSEREMEAAQRLRFEVFNVELGEGLEESWATGLDRDRFDPQCHHLLVEETGAGAVVGTYRLQTERMARAGHGFYTAQEFDLSRWPRRVLERSVEIGRAAVAREHRRGPVLLLLWQGLAAYAVQCGMRYLFGCCSITSQDPAEARRVLEYLTRRGHVHPELSGEPTPEYDCREGEQPAAGWEATRIPILFRTYLRYGAKVCGRPALDREFKTVDYLALVDLEELDPETILRRFAVDLRSST
jgi:putative hemolysin